MYEKIDIRFEEETLSARSLCIIIRNIENIWKGVY